MAKIISSIIAIFLFLYFIGIDHSAGSKYFSRIVSYNNAIATRDWQEARYLERKIDKKLARPIKETSYPEYLEVKIQAILSQKKQNIDTTLAIAKLYNQLGDNENTKKYLELARSYDPIRQDIKQALLGL